MDLGWEACVQTPLHSWTWCFLHEDAVQLLKLHVEHSGWVDVSGGAALILWLFRSNQWKHCSSLIFGCEHIRGLLYAVGRVAWLWLNDTLLLGSPTCLYSLLTFSKCSLPLQTERLPWMLLSEPALGLLGHLSLCIFLWLGKSFTDVFGTVSY